jgi:hypothetical protein
MGTHISFVRSATLDGLNIGNLLQMELGGNARASEFFRSRGVSGKVDYYGPLAAQYKDILKAAVQRAIDTRQSCLALDPERGIIEPEQQTTASDLTLTSNEDDLLENKSAPISPKPLVESPALAPVITVHTSTSSAAPIKPLPLGGKPAARIIDDFDFDSIPETVPASQPMAPSPPVKPVELQQIPRRHDNNRSMSSSQFWAEEEHSAVSSSRSTPRLTELKEKGKELLQAGKELYNSFMHR